MAWRMLSPRKIISRGLRRWDDDYAGRPRRPGATGRRYLVNPPPETGTGGSWIAAKRGSTRQSGAGSHRRQWSDATSTTHGEVTRFLAQSPSSASVNGRPRDSASGRNGSKADIIRSASGWGYPIFGGTAGSAARLKRTRLFGWNSAFEGSGRARDCFCQSARAPSRPSSRAQDLPAPEC